MLLSAALATLPAADGTAPMPKAMVFFDWHKNELTVDAKSALDEFVASNPGGRVSLIGHSDRSGSVAANQVISRRRAELVASYLESRGVDPSRITVSAAGESNPLIETADGVREVQNRRVDVLVTP